MAPIYRLEVLLLHQRRNHIIELPLPRKSLPIELIKPSYPLCRVARPACPYLVVYPLVIPSLSRNLLNHPPRLVSTAIPFSRRRHADAYLPPTPVVRGNQIPHPLYFPIRPVQLVQPVRFVRPFSISP
jgi:hypothetical protein